VLSLARFAGLFVLSLARFAGLCVGRLRAGETRHGFGHTGAGRGVGALGSVI